MTIVSVALHLTRQLLRACVRFHASTRGTAAVVLALLTWTATSLSAFESLFSTAAHPLIWPATAELLVVLRLGTQIR